MPMTRPKLNEVPLPEFFPERCKVYVTMSPGQWDGLLKEAYRRGHTLLEIEEVNGEEKAVRAYRHNARDERRAN